MLDDEYFMRRCLKLGRRAMANGDAPVGSLVVFDGRVVAEGVESVRLKSDVTAHAEIEAIRLACEKQQSLDLTGATLYTTVEPCWMCSCAIRRTNIGRVAFGSKNEEVGGVSSEFAVLRYTNVPNWDTVPLIEQDVLRGECDALLRDFQTRKLNRPSIKTFVGTSSIALHIQVWTALTATLLLP